MKTTLSFIKNLDRHQVKPLFDEHKKIVGKEVIHFPYTNPNSIYVPFVNKVLGEFGLVLNTSQKSLFKNSRFK